MEYKVYSNRPEVSKFDSLEDAYNFATEKVVGWFTIKDKNGIPVITRSENGLVEIL